LVWAGNPAYTSDRIRSLSLAAFSPLANIPGVRFYSLQKGPPAEQAKAPPAGLNLIDWTEELADFADSAALVSGLDLVVSVDTAAAHLAGALGKPTWVLIPFAPNWRWQLHREDSPWYPTLRLFRQEKSREWEQPIQRVAAALRELSLSRK
jgi:hypothetical protein